MSLHAIAFRGADLPRPLAFVKAGPRKSMGQAHTWFACHQGEAKWVLKFSDAGASGVHKLDREAAFLGAVAQLPPEDPVRERVPTLVAEGRKNGRRFVVFEFVGLEPATHWLPPRFSTSPSSLVPWLAENLSWLRVLQSHQRLRQLLDIPAHQVVCHGDFSHYNLLGGRAHACVIDWEDWSSRDERYLDALHCAVMPSLLGRDEDAQVAAFAAHWLRGGEWGTSARALIAPFLDGSSFDEAMRQYLRFQIQLAQGHSERILRLFERCEGAYLHERGR